jgi:azurin
VVIEKNHYWHQRYRATDGNDIWGGRSKLSFVNKQTNKDVLAHELTMLDVMTQNRDKAVWATAQGKEYVIDDSNVPAPVKVISNVGGGSKSSNSKKEGSLEYISGEEGLKKMSYPKDFKVNLFASEKEFPELVNPVQMQVDAKGRIWAAVWPTYPKWEPQEKTGDALLIFSDTNNDGKADKVKKFATVHNPLGFEFWNGGVLVATQPDLIFLKDTDGDDVADVRQIMLQGFGTSDTHHAANNLIYGPDGGIYWQSGIFLVNNFEHPWGLSLQTGASAMYRFDPRRHTISYHAGNSPNPHGTSFDYWGYQFANDGTGGRSYQVRPDGKGFKMFPLLKKEVRPVAADEILSSTNFPDEMEQDFVVCNTIGYLGLKRYKLHRDGYEKHKVGEIWGTPTEDFLRSDDKNFRPSDAIVGDDGALYISDWHNVIIGHMQHNVRDPNRDDKHGRIYRMVHTKKPLQEKVKIHDASIEELLENLKHPTNSIRHRSRIELTKHDSEKVISAVTQWVKQFDTKKKEDAHHLLEALWLHQQHNVRNMSLLDSLLNSPEEHARIAANTVKHHWTVADPAKGARKIDKEEEFKIVPGGIESDTDKLTKVRINTVVEKLKYDVKSFSVSAGKKIELTFVNPDALPHNIVIVNPGSADKVANAAIAMGADGFKKDFIPESDDIIVYSKMLERRETQVFQFNAPTKPGDYQFICTFPGHAQIMRGTMIVK